LRIAVEFRRARSYALQAIRVSAAHTHRDWRCIEHRWECPPPRPTEDTIMMRIDSLPATAFGLTKPDLSFKPTTASTVLAPQARASLSNAKLTKSLNTSLKTGDTLPYRATPNLKFSVNSNPASMLPGATRPGARTSRPPAAKPANAAAAPGGADDLNSLVFNTMDTSNPGSYLRSLVKSTFVMPTASVPVESNSKSGAGQSSKTLGPQGSAINAGPNAIAPTVKAPLSPVQIAGWQDNLSPAARILIPDAVVVGESHNVPGLPPGGNFALFDTNTGQPTYLGISPAASITPTGTIRLGPLGEAGVSVVGSNNTNDEAGIGLSVKVPTPAGDMLIFVNLRQDALTAGTILDALQGKVQRSITLSANVGAAFSASDVGTLGLNAIAPGAGAATATALAALGADAWVGAAYRAQVVITPDGLKFKISGQEISAAQLPQALAAALQQARTTP
jgi:hypothetical protein